MSNSNCENVTSCDGCDGCRGCDGCYLSYGLKNCIAVYKSIFCANLQGEKFKLFNKSISESRWEEIFYKLNVYYAKQTNAFELYAKNGNDWFSINPSELTYKDWEDSWSDMLKELIDYVSSLPEFDADIFQEITGIDVSKKQDTITIDGKEMSLSALKKAIAEHEG